MRKGYKITLGVLTIMILITLTIGTSYSYYSVSDVQEDTNDLTTTCFDISFSDSNIIQLNTNGSYAYPMSEANALTKKPYKFTITNTCNNTNAKEGLKYDISLNTLTATPSNLTPYLRFKLNKTAPSAAAGTSAMLNTKTDTLNPNVKTDEGIDRSYGLITGTLAPGETVSYDLYLWIDETANNDVMGYNFTCKVLVYAYM